MKVAFFVAQKQREHRQRQKDKPEPWDFGADESEDEEFKSAQGPKNNFGLERPFGAKPATKHLFADGVVLCDGGDLQIAPATPIDFDVIFAPTDIRFVRPTLVVETVKHGGDECKAVDGRFCPISNVTKGQLAVPQSEGVERLLGGERDAAQVEPSLISRQAANDRLKEEKHRDQRARPATDFLSG